SCRGATLRAHDHADVRRRGRSRYRGALRDPAGYSEASTDYRRGMITNIGVSSPRKRGPIVPNTPAAGIRVPAFAGTTAKHTVPGVATFHSNPACRAFSR